MMKKIFIIFFLIFVLVLSSCSSQEVSKKDFETLKEVILKTNDKQKYKATLVLEVKDIQKEELIMFVQGSYSIDKTENTILSGELVQTVYNTPSSFRIGFYDDTYVTISDGYKILSDMKEEELLSQFMCSPAISFSYDEVTKMKLSNVSDGKMYTVYAKDGLKDYLYPLLGDDIYNFSSMKKPQKELTEYKDTVCKYVVSSDGVLSSRETTYTIVAYDNVPYTPGVQATNDDYKRTFSVSIKLNYKSFGDDISVDITDFLPDESSTES